MSSSNIPPDPSNAFHQVNFKETLLPCQAVPPKSIPLQTDMSSNNSVPGTASFGETVQHKSTAVNVTDDSAEGNSMDNDNQTIAETLISLMKT